MERKKTILGFFIFSLGILFLVRTSILAFQSFLLDFSVYYHAASMALKHANLYALDTITQLQYIYPPVSILFLYPIALFSFSLSSQIWTLLSVGSFIGTLLVLNKIHKYSLFTNSLLFTLGVVSFPFKFTIGMGQINTILMFLIALLIYFIYKQKTFYGSFLLMIVSSIKVFPIVLLIPLLMKKKWKEVIFTILLIGLFWIISLVYFGYELNLYYIQEVLLAQLRNNAGLIYYNQSIGGVLLRINIDNFSQPIIKTLIVLTVIVLVNFKKITLLNAIYIFITTILLINNVTWQHHLILLFIPFYFALEHVNKKRLILLLIFSYILVAINIPEPQFLYSKWYGSILLSHGTLGMIILLTIQFKIYAKK